MLSREPAGPPASWSASEDALAGEPCSEHLWDGVSGTAVRNLNSVGWKRPSVFRGGEIYTQSAKNSKWYG